MTKVNNPQIQILCRATQRLHPKMKERFQIKAFWIKSKFSKTLAVVLNSVLLFLALTAPYSSNKKLVLTNQSAARSKGMAWIPTIQLGIIKKQLQDENQKNT